MSIESPVDALCSHIKFDKDKIKKRKLERFEVETFVLSDFWIQFGSAAQSLSNAVTKISFLCGKKPYPQMNELKPMLEDFFRHYSTMINLYRIVPTQVGFTWFQALTSAIERIMKYLLMFVRSLRNISDRGTSERLTLTGTVWEAIKAVDNLPKDNLQASLRALEEEESLCEDALHELESSLNEEDSNSWTDSERDLATRALGLVKVTHSCLSHLVSAVRNDGACVPPDKCNQLDTLVAIARTVSPALDEFVSELYHPVNFPAVYENGTRLVHKLYSLLSSVRESWFAGAFTSTTFNNIESCISHNHCKLDPSKNTKDPLPELSTLSVDTGNTST